MRSDYYDWCDRHQAKISTLTWCFPIQLSPTSKVLQNLQSCPKCTWTCKNSYRLEITKNTQNKLISWSKSHKTMIYQLLQIKLLLALKQKRRLNMWKRFENIGTHIFFRTSLSLIRVESPSTSTNLRRYFHLLDPCLAT